MVNRNVLVHIGWVLRFRTTTPAFSNWVYRSCASSTSAKMKLASVGNTLFTYGSSPNALINSALSANIRSISLFTPFGQQLFEGLFFGLIHLHYKGA